MQKELFRLKQKMIQTVFHIFFRYAQVFAITSAEHLHNLCKNYGTMPQSYASYRSDPLKETAKHGVFSVVYAAYGTSESYAEATNAIIMQKFCAEVMRTSHAT